MKERLSKNSPCIFEDNLLMNSGGSLERLRAEQISEMTVCMCVCLEEEGKGMVWGTGERERWKAC